MQKVGVAECFARLKYFYDFDLAHSIPCSAPPCGFVKKLVGLEKSRTKYSSVCFIQSLGKSQIFVTVSVTVFVTVIKISGEGCRSLFTMRVFLI